MSGVSWIKVSTSMFEDEKIRLIESMPDGDTLIVIWVRLLTQAGKTNDDGYIYLREGVPYTPEMLAIILNKDKSVVEMALQTFTDFGMIVINKKGILIANWEKHQNVDGLDRIRQQTKERVRRYREKKKEREAAEDENSNEESEDRNVTCNVTVTDGNAPDIEEDIDKERDKEKEKREKRKAENLSSTEDVESLVESLMASNPLTVSKKLLVSYIDCIRLTRKTARVSVNIITNLWEKWSKYSQPVLTYAMWTHIEKHDDKPEQYTLAIMRKTDEHEANRRLIMMKNRTNKVEGTSYEEHATGTDGRTTEDSGGKWDHFVLK